MMKAITGHPGSSAGYPGYIFLCLSESTARSVQEVSDINKQKFLAELAKLLTFMYEDDRQRALGAYNEMFEEAEDEQALLQALVSPLRQAVEVARAYNSGKQTLSAASKPGENEDKNDNFMETIYRIRSEAFSTQPVRAAVDEDQISLFDAPAEETAPQEAPIAEAEEAEAESAGTEEAQETEDEAEDEAEDEDEIPDAPVKAAPAAPQAPAVDIGRAGKTERKPRVFLLILFLLIAVPLTLIAVLVLLVPALVSLAAAALCFTVAVLGIISAFGSFPKIANLLVALGAALILIAFGLIFLMLFIWFLGGAIGGLINGVISLGGKWCYKEVAVQ